MTFVDIATDWPVVLVGSFFLALVLITVAFRCSKCCRDASEADPPVSRCVGFSTKPSPVHTGTTISPSDCPSRSSTDESTYFVLSENDAAGAVAITGV